jgi:hypothetical protein
MRVQPQEFLVRDGTIALCIPSYVPQRTLSDALTTPAVPYMMYRGFKYPFELLPDANVADLREIATRVLGANSDARVPRYPVRSDDVIEIATMDEVQKEMETMMQLEALREEDRMPEQPKSVPTQQQILHQAPPRAKSVEIPTGWAISPPSKLFFLV